MAYNLGFTPQSSSGQHLFVSCGRQNPSEAAPIAEALSRQVSVWYDNGTASTDGGQDEVTQQLASARAVVFFADSLLFDGEDTDMCNEMTLAKIYSKPTVCVWSKDMSSFDVRKLSDSMYNLWLDFKNMPAVNAYQQMSAADAAGAILSAVGIVPPAAANPFASTNASPFQDDPFADITAASAAGAAAFGTDDNTFNAFGTDTFTVTPPTASGAPYNPTPAASTAPTYTATAQSRPERKRKPWLIVVIIVALLVALCLLLLTMCGKLTDGTGITTETGTGVESQSAEPKVKPTYLSEAQSVDDMEVNDEIKFGSYENQEIEWIVLDKEGSNWLLLSKNVLTEKVFDDSYDTANLSMTQRQKMDSDHTREAIIRQEPYSVVKRIEYGINWNNCSLRQWLNSEFLNTAFTADEQNRINKTYIFTADVEVKPALDNLEMLSNYTISCGDDTMDKVFLLSAEECDAYFPTLTDRITNKSWWMRSNGYSFGQMDVIAKDQKRYIYDYVYDDIAQIVDESGKPSTFDGSNDINDERVGIYRYYNTGTYIFEENGVRPAIWVNVG